MFKLLSCILFLKLTSNIFLFRLDGQVAFVMKLFFLLFSYSKTVVDFADFTYKCFYFTLTYHLRHRKISVLELWDLFPPVNKSFHQTRQDYEMRIKGVQHSGCVFETVFHVNSGAFIDASPGYSLFWETKLGHEGRNLIFILVYKIFSLQSSGFYLVFFCVFPLSVGMLL